MTKSLFNFLFSIDVILPNPSYFWKINNELGYIEQSGLLSTKNQLGQIKVSVNELSKNLTLFNFNK